jgi:hypothetical protein
MPIHRMTIEDGVFAAKTVGYFDSVDGRMWANALRNQARGAAQPMVAVLDITEVNRLCPTIIKTVADVTRLPNFNGLAVVMDPSRCSQLCRVLDKLSELPEVRVFYTQDDAYRYARSRLNWALGSAYAMTYTRTPAFSF